MGYTHVTSGKESRMEGKVASRVGVQGTGRKGEGGVID